MGAFDMLSIADTSLGMHQTWLDALANNIANINTATATSQKAFQGQMVIASALPGGGVGVAGIALTDPTGQVVNDPSNPLADAQGNIRMPDIDLASEMTQLVMAQRGFQASVEVTKNAQETYSAALQIGKS
ncbi:MAG: flagellar basal-body rod protein [Marmoricola sp.]|nr:flagellar basal-body rod protein [Marmoricola sp.]